MKINKIVIENLASLKGKHEINFEEIEKQSSLFAITGETGAGKSTILNAISLAIFGKNYKKILSRMILSLSDVKVEKLRLLIKSETKFTKVLGFAA